MIEKIEKLKYIICCKKLNRLKNKKKMSEKCWEKLNKLYKEKISYELNTRLK